MRRLNNLFPPQSMTPTLSSDTYFDLSNSSFKELFTKDRQVWEAIVHLDEYIASQFEQGHIQANYLDLPDVYVGAGTVIAASAVIEGPAIIGDGCTIGHGAYIRGGCVLGAGVHVGHAVELKHSVILDDASIAHLNYIGDSIVGARANVSGGAICANFRLDKKPVTIDISGQRISTAMEKFGAVIGDGCNVGVNAVLNPGTILGKGCVVYPLQSVTGTHEAGSVIR